MIGRAIMTGKVSKTQVSLESCGSMPDQIQKQITTANSIM
jgi:hypothetical protein